MTRPFVDFARRRGWLAAALLACLLALPGCALLPSTDPARADASGERPAPAPQRSDTARDAPTASAFDLRVECDDAELRTLVERHAELLRYRAITDLDEAELARLLVLAERDVRQLLATEGYFSPVVKLRRDGTRGARPTVVIAIEPGAPTTVTHVDIGFEGQIASDDDADAVAQRRAIVDGWSLDQGRRFTQQRWSDAKTDALRALVARRYPRGRIAYSLADVDAAGGRAHLHLRLDSGPLFRLGPAQVQGAQRYPPELAERLSWLRPGQVYDQKQLVDAQQRLTGSGYYDSAYLSIDPEGDAAAVPVSFTVTEARRHKVQLGVGYSTDAGPRLTLEHRDNRAFASSWRSQTRLNLNRKTPLLQAELTSLPDAGGWRWGALARYQQQDDGLLNTLSRTLRIGRSRIEATYDRNVYLNYEHASVTGSATRTVPDALLGDGAALSAGYAWTGRHFDRLPLPTRGWGLGLDASAGLTTVGARRPFARLTAHWLGIVPLAGGASRLALRAEGGAVIADRRARLPGSHLFRTGGDTTVRGYGWRRIGMPVGQGLVGPGRYLALGSVEWQRPILQDRWPGLLEHSLFIDVGSVANRADRLRPHWGVGTGLRMITPVGPMQLDIAYGLKSKEIRLHMTVGLVF